MADLIPIPWGEGYLQATRAEFDAMLARGLVPGANAAPAPPSMAGQALLDSRAMGERLSVSAEQVEAMAKRGEVPSVRVGRYLRFNPAEVVASLPRSGHADC